ncbi:MAG: hypothetical protein R6U70_07340 [Bacillota bacterium]
MQLGRDSDIGTLLLFLVLAGGLGDVRRDDQLLQLLLFIFLAGMGDFQRK